MTMVFLPGTFFAALFAIPSLKWDQPKVIQKKFWVYWAFTLPSTAIVLLAWIFITNRTLIYNSISRPFEKNSVAAEPNVEYPMGIVSGGYDMLDVVHGGQDELIAERIRRRVR